MKLNTPTFSKAGPRGINQDRFLMPISFADRSVVAIADGVGGSGDGGKAAEIVLDVLSEQIEKGTPIPELLNIAQSKLEDVALSQDILSGLATTLTILELSGSNARVYHIGDTRITHFRGHGVMGRTKDHTELQKLLDEGVLTPSQARNYPRKNVIYSALSSKSNNFEVFENKFEMQTCDRLILSTDGFHSLFSKKELAAISERTGFDDFFDEVTRSVEMATLEDDATAVFLEIE